MAGILDKKTRFMDTLLTDLGRQQLAKGELQFSFATFSDMGTFYEMSDDDPSVAEDATGRIMLEVFSRQQDLIIPEFDADSNSLFPAGDFNIVANGDLLPVSGSLGTLRGEQLILSSSLAIGNTLESLKELMPLRSIDPIRRQSGFELSSNKTTFTVSETGPLPADAQKTKRLSNSESLWQDKRLTHVDNFNFLPPVSKGTTRKLADYPRLEQPEPLTFTDLSDSLGIDSDWRATSVADLSFEKTSVENNVICQVWEVSSGSLTKLRVIDFGEFEDEDPFSPGRHVFFVGKLRSDDAGQNTFLNMFTVVFD